MLADELSGYSLALRARMVGWQGSATGQFGFVRFGSLWYSLVLLGVQIATGWCTGC